MWTETTVDGSRSSACRPGSVAEVGPGQPKHTTSSRIQYVHVPSH
ncbi:MAG: hypothetical protein AVDCRST_MAG76-3393 [uncultured Acidimicrobiales bacterium]|uniref:Uncharacterized protein n=1 Tax=uncultured Acidimicrobiales bacterium TaxID=310071 RepID=A0A6J4J8K0_9ACTN|nr:MAG: hypothetical protein AVDCRST_MAG76-3393 [uncultured Acidimicrobiales bacterium]